MLDGPNKSKVSPMSLLEQKKIFSFAINEQLQLSDALNYFGKTIDDLIYERSRQEGCGPERPRCLNDFVFPKHHIPLGPVNTI